MKNIRQLTAVAVTSGVAVASLVLPTAANATSAPSTKSPAAAAAGYLARHLAGKHNDHYIGSYACGKNDKDTCHYVNYGQTADAILSLDAAGVAQRAAKAATAYLEKHVTDYAGSMSTAVSPGGAAKLLLVAEAQHVNPESFGGADLIGDIISTEGSGGGKPGEFSTQYGSPLIQSLAMLALANTVQGQGPGSQATTFLGNEQCSDGAFPAAYLTTSSTDCKAADEDVDTTGYAIQAMVAVGNNSSAADAIHWLKKQENANGGWPETPGGSSDANSTAIATEALVAAHANDTAALAWLAKHQLGCGDPKGRRGAVTYQGTYDATSALLASSQAGVALAGKDLAGVDKNGAHGASPVLSCPAHHSK